MVLPQRKLGMTATRRGLTATQTLFLRAFMSLGNELHDGDCKGGDSQGFFIAKDLGLRTIGHPPIIAKNRANNVHDFDYLPLPYFVRNRNIVDAAEIMLACPRTDYEEFRGSGTWHAIRYTRSCRKPLIIIGPNGAIVTEQLDLELTGIVTQIHANIIAAGTRSSAVYKVRG